MNFKKLESACKAQGINEVEVYHVEESGSAVSTFNGEVDKNSAFFSNRLYIRGVYNGKIVSCVSEKDVDEEIDVIVNRIKDNANAIETDEPYFIYGGSKEYKTLAEKPHDFDEYSQNDKIELCKKYEKMLRERSEFVQMTSAEIEMGTVSVTIENSNGLSVSRKNEECVCVGEAIITKGGESKTGFYYDYVDNIKDFDTEKMLERAVDRTVSSIGAKSTKSAQYKVVFENEAFCELLSCFTSMFSADMVIKKMSQLEGKIGTKIFGDNITLTDLPLLEKSHSKYTFDDEGVATSDTVVVENGVLKTFLHNLKTAKIMGTESTGNGYKDPSGNVQVGPANLTLKCGEKTLDQVLSDVKDGIYITDLMGTHAGVNPVSGAFNLQSSGFRITNGKLGDPVTLIIVSGNIVELLNNVEEIANDLETGRGVASGSVYVKSLAVSGKEE